MNLSQKQSSLKKVYSSPQFVDYGEIADITQEGGGSTTDVPVGTVVATDATINDVTS